MEEIHIQVVDTEIINIQVETPGASKFIELEDVPQAYDDGKYVKSTTSGLIFAIPGDMLKLTYDINENGIVDNSEKLNGKADTEFATSAQGIKADSALQNIVEDPNPLLGGDLNTNNKHIGAILQTNDAQNQSKLLQTEDIFDDFVVFGLLPATSTTLTSDISAGKAYVSGVRVVKAVTSYTYTASKDTYLDLDSTGTYTFVEVANGAAEPATTADSIRLAKVVTDASAITTVTDMRNSNIGIENHYVGIMNSNPLAPLHVGDNNQSNSIDSVILISRKVNDNVIGNGHAFSDSSYITRGGDIAYASYDVRAIFSGSNNYNHYAGIQIAPVYNSTGRLSILYGLVSIPEVENGTLYNLYHLYASDQNVTGGTITSQYGLYIPEMTKASNNWGIYTKGFTQSYLGGSLYVGAEDTNGFLQIGNQNADGTEAKLYMRGRSTGGTNLAVDLHLYSGLLEMTSQNISAGLIMINTVNGDISVGSSGTYYKTYVKGTFGFAPGSSVIPANNGDIVVEATDDTHITFKLKGSDGTVRSGSITLS